MLFSSEILRVALSAVWANKLRSTLTMLGIVIGIAAVITMLALGGGAQQQIQAQLQSMGTNVLTVSPGAQFQGGIDRGTSARLTVAAAEALMVEPRYIRDVAPEMEGRAQVVYGRQNANLSILGTWPSYFDIQNHELAMGRLFTMVEDQGRRRVAVVGYNVAERLGLLDPSLLLGQSVEIRGIPFEVVGILKAKGQSGFASPDEVVYIPIGTAEGRVLGTDRVRSIYVKALDEKSMDPAMAEIDRVLRREQKLRPGQASNFSIRDQTALLETFEAATRTFTYLLAGIAAVSLLVGGIGIMNIMLVSVTERTREIGVRKALGARRGAIMFQFLIEALVLCLAGGLVGVGVGVGGSHIVSNVAGWNTGINVGAIVLALAFSGGVGLFFGLWPARRAAVLDPIVALRYE
ncbi:MAG TPA: ABC transporter permease [Longimicrobiales bacterium]|nr:ABC transporter permease [Longimicrobiales bacterium]